MARNLKPNDIEWRKSSYCGGLENECVEVADGPSDIARVRDSKNPGGPILAFPAENWSSFVEAIKEEENHR
ncbi:DUF397 domain-containing protein [Streptomyces sp. B1866]|uniref:DUF397 domain-containing protein n=1 Tax=Streptomyces sp. B1866 TaxID=3075431 RepID=UPI00288DD347|nr:DUF397 domain-containing protein [Streptomyces sp. B1866]MDT3397466.1 DUF397 domain-containing protein [Streptomyces sp. B1866]